MLNKIKTISFEYFYDKCVTYTWKLPTFDILRAIFWWDFPGNTNDISDSNFEFYLVYNGTLFP